MNNQRNTPDEKKSPVELETEKKPYEKPAVIYQTPLEAFASACTFTGGKASGQCTTAFS